MSKIDLEGPSTTLTTTFKLASATVILVAFFALFVYMLWIAVPAPADKVWLWERSLVLYNGVLALVFAAAGALLGTKIQADRVADATARADKAQTRADDNADKAKAAEAAERMVQQRRDGTSSRVHGLTEAAEPDEFLETLSAVLAPARRHV